MLICYLDDSGTGTDSPVLTMAGYVGAFHAWIAFEQSAREVFAEFSVTQLHGKEFNDTKGDFKGWPRRKKEAFAARLYLQLRRTAEFGVNFSIVRGAYHRARFEFGEKPRESAYGHCFQNVVDAIMRSSVMKYYAAEHRGTLSFVVEAGNKNDADIVRIFNEIKLDPRHAGVDRILKTVTFADKGSAIALQMADFLAFHSRRYAIQCERAKTYLPLSDLQKVIFDAVPTSASVSHGYLTNEEIAAGVTSPPGGWRRVSPLY
ncbi:MAG TPA: DUF3800 domain-containing protein [Bradyrhizobium sp.]|nr:DUF3800 domain-containing protein [Bradyrhizobium sp.]